MNRMRMATGGLIILVLSVTGTVALASGNGEEDWTTPEAEAARENPGPATPEGITRARKVYDKQCVMCHGPKGKGDGPVAKTMGIHPADLTDGDMVSAMSDGEIFYKITTGREPMPSFRRKIEEEDRWLLVHLVRSFGEETPTGDEIDAAR